MSRLVVGGVVIDTLLNITETSPAELSDKSIERGAYIADHIDKQPPTIQCQCIMIEPTKEGLGSSVNKRFKKLQEFQKNGNRLVVTGAENYYENLVVENVIRDKDSKIANGWKFTINFKYAHVIEAKRAIVKVGEIPEEPPRPAGTDDGVYGGDTPVRDTPSSGGGGTASLGGGAGAFGGGSGGGSRTSKRTENNIAGTTKVKGKTVVIKKKESENVGGFWRGLANPSLRKPKTSSASGGGGTR